MSEKINPYQQRLQARRERLLARAEKARQEARSADAYIEGIREAIPMGQPILVGHHSERRHRRDLDRWARKARASVAALAKAKRLEERAARVGKGGVSGDDPDALEKLRRELAQREAAQEKMKAANAAIRRNAKRGEQAQVAALLELGFAEDKARELLTPDFAGRIGFPSYALTNNNASIRRVRQRIEQLEREADAQDVEIEGDGWTYFEDTADNRLGFIFDAKPDDDTRAMLRSHGFRWSPSRSAWVRHLHTSRNVAAYVRELLAKA